MIAASFIPWGTGETPQCVRLPFAPCGPVQEDWWSPIRFGSSDVRRRHLYCNAGRPPRLHFRLPQQSYRRPRAGGQSQPSPTTTRTLFGGSQGEYHTQPNQSCELTDEESHTVSLIDLKSGFISSYKQTMRFVVNW